MDAVITAANMSSCESLNFCMGSLFLRGKKREKTTWVKEGRSTYRTHPTGAHRVVDNLQHVSSVHRVMVFVRTVPENGLGCFRGRVGVLG